MEQSNCQKNLNELTHTCTTAHTGKQAESQSVLPEMGEVEALAYWPDHEFKSQQYPKIQQLADIARRAIASHAQEKQRAEEAERLLRWWVEFKDGFGQLEGISVGSAVNEWKENARRILAICGKGDG